MAILFDGLDMKIEELKIQMALSEDNAEIMDLNLKLAKLIAVKPEQLFQALVNILGMAAVLNFEQFNIISSKMWSIVSNRFFK